MRLSLLALASLAFAAPCSAQQVGISDGSVVETVAKLKPGQYVWVAEIAPQGPMLLVVNVATQRAVLFRNGVPIAASTISTGRPGYETPTGVFTILEKKVEHYSRKYDNAPMPYMERLTWKGIALHAGQLPGRPASHGCIRMPAGFAKLLYGVTRIGMTVVITGRAASPRVAPTPTLLSGAAEQSNTPGQLIWEPEKSLEGPVSVVVSASDRRAVVLRNGVIIGSAPVAISGEVSGTWAYALRAIGSDGQHWIRLDLSPGYSGDEAVPRQEWERFSAPEAFKKAVAGIVHPGMTIVVTADSLRPAASQTVLESEK
jgi:hypothetical protein